MSGKLPLSPSVVMNIVMPFASAPSVFQALINYVLRETLNQMCYVYIDGILIFSQNPSQHITPALPEEPPLCQAGEECIPLD